MTDESDDDPRLEDISEAAIINHLRSRSILILEAAISALMDGHSTPEVVQILRAHADHLEEHG